MKHGYKEIRRLSSTDLRSLCIRENWYTGGTVDEYSKLLSMTKRENITTDDIVEMATDIIGHSDAAVEKYMNFGGLDFDEVYAHVMFLIAEICYSYFVESV